MMKPLFALILLLYLPVAASVQLVGGDFKVPLEKIFDGYRLEKVNPQYAEMDFEALMSARFYIRSKLNSTWPADDFTLTENRKTLVDDVKAFDNKLSFTYSVLNRAKTKILGCVYITPAAVKGADASVFVWVRQDTKTAAKFQQQLLTEVKQWLAKDWPFSKVDYSLNH